jgi:hypothetical protein
LKKYRFRRVPQPGFAEAPAPGGDEHSFGCVDAPSTPLDPSPPFLHTIRMVLIFYILATHFDFDLI